jgi:hypothetical protein
VTAGSGRSNHYYCPALKYRSASPELNKYDAHRMTRPLRERIEYQRPSPLSSEVEVDEIYVTVCHTGHPSAVKNARIHGKCLFSGFLAALEA